MYDLIYVFACGCPFVLAPFIEETRAPDPSLLASTTLKASEHGTGYLMSELITALSVLRKRNLTQQAEIKISGEITTSDTHDIILMAESKEEL